MKRSRQREGRLIGPLGAKERGECERCTRQGRPRYRVRSDCLDIKVCAECAEAARELGLCVFEVKDESTAGDSQGQG